MEVKIMKSKLQILFITLIVFLTIGIITGKIYLVEDTIKTKTCCTISVDLSDFDFLVSEIYKLIDLAKMNDNADVSSLLKERAESWIGVKYRYGGEDHNGIDCSAFIKQIYSGINNLPRTAAQQCKFSNQKIAINKLRVGDLVFMKSSKKVDHVAMIYGFTKKNEPLIIHASGRVGQVTIEKLSQYNNIIFSFNRFEDESYANL